jgi:hypothetical protein
MCWVALTDLAGVGQARRCDDPAVRSRVSAWRYALLVLAVMGITLVHLANNLMNDLYDTWAAIAAVAGI